MLNIRISGPVADIAGLHDSLKPLVARASDLSCKDNEDGSARLYLRFADSMAATILANFAAAVGAQRGAGLPVRADNTDDGIKTVNPPPAAERYRVTWRR